jgi:hypothetical protein
MKSKTNSSAGRIAQLGLALFALFGFSQMAHATLAANHVIQNAVTIQYQDGSGAAGPDGTGSTTYSDSDTVDVTINLVQVAPDVVNTNTASELDPVSTNQALALTFTVTSNANGVDDYFFENDVFSNNDANDAASSTSVTNTVPTSPLTLGGSSYAGLDGTKNLGVSLVFSAAGVPSAVSFVVPMDNDTGDSTLSGFAAGDTIVFAATGTNGGSSTAGDIVCTIDSVSDGAVVNDVATITVTSPCDTGGQERTVDAGDQIGERQTLTVNFEAGDLAGNIDLDAEINTKDSGTVTFTSTINVEINIVGVDLRVERFVRNTNTSFNPTCGSANPFACLTIQGGETYYSTGVTANPGDTLQYAILMYNVNGQVTSVTGVDPIVLFTTYVDNSARLYPTVRATNGGALCATKNGTCTVDDGAGAAPSVSTPTDDDSSGDDFVFYNQSSTPVQVEFSAGDTGTADEAPNSETKGGQIPSSFGSTTEANASVFTFEVTVDN